MVSGASGAGCCAGATACACGGDREELIASNTGHYLFRLLFRSLQIDQLCWTTLYVVLVIFPQPASGLNPRKQDT